MRPHPRRGGFGPATVGTVVMLSGISGRAAGLKMPCGPSAEHADLRTEIPVAMERLGGHHHGLRRAR